MFYEVSPKCYFYRNRVCVEAFPAALPLLDNNAHSGEFRVDIHINLPNCGEPWLVGKDVVAALGYSAERNAIAAHVDDEDKLTHQVSASGQMRNVTLINEFGLYALVLSIKLPTGKKFRH